MVRRGVSLFLPLVLLVAVGPATEDTATIRLKMRDIEARLKVTRDDFKGRVFYNTSLEGDILHKRQVFYPYISYSPEKNSRTLFGLLRIKADDWLMLEGVIVLVGEKRHTYTLDFMERYSLHKTDVYMSGYSPICVEWLHLPTKTTQSHFQLFKAIGNAPDTTTIRIRALGSEGSRDWTLTKKERQAWQDMVYYYQHFKHRD